MSRWPAAWANLRALDGEAWDTECERLDMLWKAEYITAFVAFAVLRNWTAENADEWAQSIVDDALIERKGDPKAAAEADVIECEWEG
jgi:hypothetical protein